MLVAERIGCCILWAETGAPSQTAPRSPHKALKHEMYTVSVRCGVACSHFVKRVFSTSADKLTCLYKVHLKQGQNHRTNEQER